MELIRGQTMVELRNDGKEDFVYLSVTAPPLDFTGAYEQAAPAGEK